MIAPPESVAVQLSKVLDEMELIVPHRLKIAPPVPDAEQLRKVLDVMDVMMPSLSIAPPLPPANSVYTVHPVNVLSAMDIVPPLRFTIAPPTFDAEQLRKVTDVMDVVSSLIIAPALVAVPFCRVRLSSVTVCPLLMVKIGDPPSCHR